MTIKSGGGADDNGGLHYWRDYFRTANADIFGIIEQAILVAASDRPTEFKVKRDRIAELLFSCRLTRCLGCDKVELAVSADDDDNLDGEIKGSKIKEDEFDDHVDGASKGCKVNRTSRNDNGEIGRERLNMVVRNHKLESNFSYGDAEALTDEIEEERETVGEVLRIKEILLNSQDESDSVLFDSLRRLQLMALNVDLLKATEIGKAVNGIRKHNSKQIRHLARQLIDGWKIIVDEWVKATQEIAEGGTPDSLNPSTVDEEEGLPSPPLDEGAFFATQNMDFSQFFDGMDDDGNPRNYGEFNNKQGVGRKPYVVQPGAPKRGEEPPKEANKVQQLRRQEPLSKPNKPSNTQSGPGRSTKPNGQQTVSVDPKAQQKFMIQRQPVAQTEKRSSNEDAVEDKLEATKRRLQERYQEAENAKRQRTIQVMELHDLPRQGLVNKNPNGRFGNHNRPWANGRR